ncbi:MULTISPECIES: NAD(P)-dependent oxidoreductase [Haloferax]|uniref:Sugar nucleotide-binding protein n=1 Tax=Haloferax marinum TaxID=2666143 RepID=A0A6A8GB81_9EURY|nr:MULTISPECIES: NAD(P)-dependent oxidoreductase [Haloferax]KAB1198218.1 NAD(P)-dependent oxidoreductase [Haloferax sp. CBA1150]MRW97306.1 sugar nucleotide-binding protein [Haloferax marinum]
MRTLVSGTNGLLGSVVVETLLGQGFDVVGGYHSEPPQFDIPLHEVDITDSERVATLVSDYEVDTVVNCAAFTDVDGCETNSELANEVNGVAPGAIAEVCAERDIDFVHYSTDYVFAGDSDERYVEDGENGPVQEYGASKLTGEESVRNADSDALILRLSFVYGARGDTGELTGFPQWVASTLAAGDEVPLFTDQQFTPSRAGHVAETTRSLLEADATGTFHVTSRSCVTPYEFGEEICNLTGGDDALIESSSMSDLNRKAARPQNSCLDVSKVEEELGRPQPTLADDLVAIEGSFSDYMS